MTHVPAGTCEHANPAQPDTTVPFRTLDARRAHSCRVLVCVSFRRARSRANHIRGVSTSIGRSLVARGSDLRNHVPAGTLASHDPDGAGRPQPLARPLIALAQGAEKVTSAVGVTLPVRPGAAAQLQYMLV